MNYQKEITNSGLISYHFDSGIKGKHLLIIGNIHGNEVCGTFAIRRCIEEFVQNQLHLQSGAVTFIPSCNPPAHIDNVRAVNVDMNRIIGQTETIDVSFYEVELARDLEKKIQNSDILFSIHSCSAKTEPFAIRDWDSDPELNQWSHNIGVRYVVTGWENIHPGAGDTASYAKSFGKKSLTIECGQVGDIRNQEIAYRSIFRTLQYWKLLSITSPTQKEKVVEVEMMKEIVRPSSGKSNLSLKPFPTNLQSFSKGDKLAEHDQKLYVKAPFHGVFIMPKFDAQPGESWFYLAQRKEQ